MGLFASPRSGLHVSYQDVKTGRAPRQVPLEGTDSEIKNAILDIYGALRDAYQPRNDRMAEFRDLYYLRHYSREPLEGEPQITLATATNVVDLGQGILATGDVTFHVVPGRESQLASETATLVEKFLAGVLYVNSMRQERDVVADAIFHQLVTGWGCFRVFWDVDFAAAPMNVPTTAPPTLPSVSGSPTMQPGLAPIAAGATRYQGGPVAQPPVLGGPVAQPPMPGGPMAQPPPYQPLQLPRLPTVTERGPSPYAELPIVIQAVDPSYVYPRPGGRRGRWKAVCFACKRPAGEIEDEWSVKITDLEIAEDDLVLFVDYWEERRDGIYNAILAGDTLIRRPTKMQGYTTIPYVIFFGRPTPSSDEDEMGLPLTFAVKDSIFEMEYILNRQARLINLYGNLPIIAEDGEGEAIEVDVGLGDVVHVRPGQKLSLLTWPGSPPDVQRQLTYFQAHAQESSFPRIVYGEGPAGASGYALTTMSEGGRIRLVAPRKELERALTLVANKIVELAANFSPHVPVRVYGRHLEKPFAVSVTGAEMTGFRIEVGVRAQTPQDEMRRTAQAVQLQQTRLLSDRTLRERYLQVEHPDDEELRLLVQVMRQHPALLDAAVRRALIQWGVEPPPPSPMVQAARSGVPIQPPGPPGRPPAGQPGNMPPRSVPGAGPSPVPPQIRSPLPPGLQAPTGAMPPAMTNPLPQAMGLPPRGIPPELMALFASLRARGMLGG